MRLAGGAGELVKVGQKLTSDSVAAKASSFVVQGNNAIEEEKNNIVTSNTHAVTLNNAQSSASLHQAHP